MAERNKVFDAALPHLKALRDEGYAVVVWSPDELEGATPSMVEDRSIELGWDVIDTLKPRADNK